MPLLLWEESFLAVARSTLGADNLRVWTGIIEEELDKISELERLRIAAEGTTTPKAKSAAKPLETLTEGCKRGETEKPDKRLGSPKKRRIGLRAHRTNHSRSPSKAHRKRSRTRSRSKRERERERERESERESRKRRRSRGKESRRKPRKS